MASRRDGAVQLVCGKKVVEIDGAALRTEASAFERVVVDLGAGDGRFAYRLARAHPTWFCLAVDANADGMIERSYRAGRKPSRGGITNIRFIRAAVEGLPPALDGLADEITILYPWASLLQAVTLPDPETLGRIARLGKPGARLRLRVNTSILRHSTNIVLGLHEGIHGVIESLNALLIPVYEASGIHITGAGAGQDDTLTSWGRRLDHSGATVIALDGVIQGSAPDRLI